MTSRYKGCNVPNSEWSVRLTQCVLGGGGGPPPSSSTTTARLHPQLRHPLSGQPVPHYSGQQHHTTTTGGVYINPRYNTKAVADLVVGRQHHRHGGGGAVAAEPQEMIVIDYADGGGGGGGDPVQHRLNPHHHQQPHHHHQHYGRLGSSGSNSGIRDPIQVRVKERATNMGTYFILTCSEGSVLRSLSIFSRPRASARDPAPGVKVTFGFFFLNTPQNNHLFLGRVPGTYLSNFVKEKDFFKSCVRFS